MQTEDQEGAVLRQSSSAIFNSDNVTMTPVSLTVDGPMTLEEINHGLNQIWGLKEASQWWEIDLFVWAKRTFPNTFGQLLDGVRYQFGTTMNRIRLGESIPPHARVEGLSIAHHMEVVPNHIPLEEKVRWLQMAREEGWTRDDLRYHLYALSSGEEEPVRPKPMTYTSAVYMMIDWLDDKVSYSKEELKQVLLQFLEEMKK